MSKRPRAVVALFAALTVWAGSNVWAGDSASFVDLGFSADGKVYMFAQYGVESASLKPWAELFTVDVPRNDFVKNGVKKAVGKAAVDAGQDGAGIFHSLLEENAALTKKYKVDHKRQGSPLYVATENGGGKSGQILEFRDFDAESSYKAKLVSNVEGKGDKLHSSFFISVERTLKSGKVKKYIVGSPAIKRAGVVSYAVRRVVAAPRDGSLVFVIETVKNGAKGPIIRYMVEVFRL
ncbi:MAG: DUF2259 domain-containing protein [Treponemataceae bacterium]